jgi:hypothetical protein
MNQLESFSDIPVLMIDDDVRLQELLGDYLPPHGLIPLASSSGDKIVNWLRKKTHT